jgi:signal transduction histidine kinase
MNSDSPREGRHAAARPIQRYADLPTLGSALMNSEDLAPADVDDPLREMALKLRAAEDTLEQALRTHSEFLWALGHALRSPLTAILGFAELMDAGMPAPTPRQKNGLAQILKAGWGLLTLIDEILDASLLECGQLQLQMEHLSLEDVLRECEALARPLACQNDVDVVFAWPAQPLFVMADRARLRQILMTLVGHALSHSGAAGSVHVSCHRCADGRTRVHFRDTSCGRSVAWLTHDDPANHIKLIVSQQLAGYMGGAIATENIAGLAGNVSAYWLELNAKGLTP